jgi:hypothetical protein
MLLDCSVTLQLPHVTYGSTPNVAVQQVRLLQCIQDPRFKSREIGNVTFLNVMYKFLIYLFTSALHVSGFLLAHFQSQVYNFGSGSTLLGMVSAPETCKAEVNR